MDNNVEKLLLEGQNRLSISMVESVDGFSEQMLKLTVKGKRILIKGEKIKINQFNKDNGNFLADGLFKQIDFLEKNKPLVKRLFK